MLPADDRSKILVGLERFAGCTAASPIPMDPAISPAASVIKQLVASVVLL